MYSWSKRSLQKAALPNPFISELWAGEELDEVFVAMSFSEQYRSRFDYVFRPTI